MRVTIVGVLALALTGCTSIDRVPEPVVRLLTTEPWFSIACGPRPDDWPECHELKRWRDARWSN